MDRGPLQQFTPREMTIWASNLQVCQHEDEFPRVHRAQSSSKLFPGRLQVERMCQHTSARVNRNE